MTETAYSAGRIIHLHIPKTAGTALKAAFEKSAQGKARIFPHYDERKFADVNPDDYDFYSGHFGFKTASRLGGNVVTVLRSPVDRFLSVYYFWRQLAERGVEKTRNTAMASNYPLSEFAKLRDEPFLIEEFSNRMTWQIAHGSSIEMRRELRDRGMTDNDVFNLALKNLSLVSVLGIQERIPAFSAELKRKLSLSLDISKINVTQKRESASDIDTGTVKAIQEWMPMDIELYHQALKILPD